MKKARAPQCNHSQQFLKPELNNTESGRAMVIVRMGPFPALFYASPKCMKWLSTL